MERRRTPSLWATTSKATPSHFPRSISIRSSSTSGSSEKAAAVSYARVNGEETTASYRRPSTRRARAATCRRPASLSPALPRPCQAAAALASDSAWRTRSEEHTSELQSRENLVCRLLLEKKKIKPTLILNGIH